MENKFGHMLSILSDGDLIHKAGIEFDVQILKTEVYVVDYFDCQLFGYNNRN